jgi:hypothetical protein
MSAFVVSDTHIDALVSAGLAFARPSEPMTWYHAGPDGLDRAYRLRPDNPTEVGAMLLAANQSSVNLLYGERGSTKPAYSFRRLSGIPDPVVILKAIACFEYQCCEHPDWAASQARQFCQELRDRCIDRLPGYQQAPWALSDRRIFLRR